MEKLAIVGTGGFAREVLALIEDINRETPKYNFVGFVDGSLSKGTMINDYPVIGNDEEINNIDEPLLLVVAIGSPIHKMRIRKKYSNPNISFPTIVHPSAIIGNRKFVNINEGCIVCAGTVITTNVTIGRFVIFNLLCTVGHDTQIGNYSSFMPNVNISGEVHIGNSVYVGTGAKIINQLSIGDGTIVGAGAVVTKTLPENCTAVGIPARPIKFH